MATPTYASWSRLTRRLRQPNALRPGRSFLGLGRSRSEVSIIGGVGRGMAHPAIADGASAARQPHTTRDYSCGESP